jgi:hypothetical protein
MPEQQEKQTQRVNLFLDPDIVLKAKVQALKEDVSLSKLVDKALAFYMEQKK